MTGKPEFFTVPPARIVKEAMAVSDHVVVPGYHAVQTRK
jgi:hypothetical protein